MRCIASALFLVAHGLLVLEHITIGTALHGIAELLPLDQLLFLLSYL